MFVESLLNYTVKGTLKLELLSFVVQWLSEAFIEAFSVFLKTFFFQRNTKKYLWFKRVLRVSRLYIHSCLNINDSFSRYELLMKYVKRQKYHHLDSQKQPKKYSDMDRQRYVHIQSLQGKSKSKAFFSNIMF